MVDKVDIVVEHNQVVEDMMMVVVEEDMMVVVVEDMMVGLVEEDMMDILVVEHNLVGNHFVKEQKIGPCIKV